MNTAHFRMARWSGRAKTWVEAIGRKGELHQTPEEARDPAAHSRWHQKCGRGVTLKGTAGAHSGLGRASGVTDIFLFHELPAHLKGGKVRAGWGQGRQSRLGIRSLSS